MKGTDAPWSMMPIPAEEPGDMDDAPGVDADGDDDDDEDEGDDYDRMRVRMGVPRRHATAPR